MEFLVLVPWLVAAGVMVGVFLGGLLARRIAFAQLQRWARHTHNSDDIVIGAVRGPSPLWGIALVGASILSPTGQTTLNGRFLGRGRGITEVDLSMGPGDFNPLFIKGLLQP